MPEYATTEEDETLPEGPELAQQRADVKQWLKRIECAKAKWEPDFKRMRENMEFCSGLQWNGQTTIEDKLGRYINNLVLRTVSQKVSTLYAKDPVAVAERRRRLDFRLWDGNVESLMEQAQQAQMHLATGMPLAPEQAAFWQDVAQGRERQKLVDRVCETLNIVYQYQIDTAQPEFKERMKTVVRAVVTAGVGYVKPVFCSDNDVYAKVVSTGGESTTMQARTARMKELLRLAANDEFDENSAHYQTLRSLIVSVGATQALQDDFVLPERLEFDFPACTSIIPDELCTDLKEFVGCRWITQEFVLPVEEVNAIFQTKIKVGTGAESAKDYTKEASSYGVSSYASTANSDETGANQSKLVCLYEVFDKRTKTHFFICDGWRDYVLAPEALTPAVSGFWPIFGLTFNDVIVEPGCKASPFPPSDVQLAKSPQKEWNRSREALRDQRNANAPKYLVRKGFLTDEDKEALKSAEPSSIIELAGVPPEQPLDRFVVPFQFAPIDPRMYDTIPLEQDLLTSVGMQQANIGPAQPNVTATVGTIAEQSRMNVSASNIDDLDGMLSRLARAGGEMLLQSMSREIATRIAGIGAAWPSLPETRQDFLLEVFLRIEAASSGRPNKAVDIANFRDIAPLMLQAGANPIGIVKEAARRMGDHIDPAEFFPLLPSGAPSPQATSPAGSEGKPPMRDQSTQNSQGETQPASANPS